MMNSILKMRQYLTTMRNHGHGTPLISGRCMQTRQERNNKVNPNYRTNAADIDKSTMNAKHILIIGDSQLYGIDQSKMSRTHAIKLKA